MPTRILVLKTGALGDVIRTTSILPGLHQRYEDLEVCWVTAHGARPLVEHHPLIARVESLDPKDAHEAGLLARSLSAREWDRVLSFDDEEPMCALASLVPTRSLSGATLEPDGARVYTDDVSAWFEMGLLSRKGKQAADRLKIANQRTHPEIFASMLGIEQGQPGLYLTDLAREKAANHFAAMELERSRPVIGLNTGAGGRWKTKELPIERSLELARRLHASLGGQCAFLVLGGPDEAERNRSLTSGLRDIEGVRAVDAGVDNSLLEFAAWIGQTDLLISSDSMALHMGIALRKRCVCFFAPTSAAEIELYGLGEKVWSTAPDYCSYSRDADNSTVTAERIWKKAVEVLAR